MKLRAGLVTILFVGLGGAYFVAHLTVPSAPDRYPEFRTVSGILKSRILAAMGDPGLPLEQQPAAIVPGCTPLALLAALRERHPEPSNWVRHNPYFMDEANQPFGRFIAESRDPTLNPLLLRMIADTRLGAPPRQAALVGICWPGNSAALPGLVEFVVDPEQDHTMRQVLIERLHRIGTPPGPRFRDLLLIPYDRLDVRAAAALTLMGEPVAPSLVLQGIAGNVEHPDGETHLCARAVAVLARDDPELRTLVDRSLPLLEKRSWHSSKGESREVTQRERRQLLAAIAERFDAWLASHPDARISSYEAGREAYRNGDRRRREVALQTFEDILSTPEEELDFASAALLVSGWSKELNDLNLDRLDRLAVLFRRELEGIRDPVEQLAVLNRRLLTRHLNMRGWRLETGGGSSFLADVLKDRGGNCIGLVSLYVALGDRLDLPLEAVLIPRHVFLRFDDGERRLDFELTDLGRLRTDGELAGATPRVLSRKELVSAILSNRSEAWLTSPWIKDTGRTETALKYARESLELDPRNASGHLALARALVADGGSAERALEAVRQAIALDPTEPTAVLVGAELLLGVGRAEESLEWYERVLATEPDSIPARIGRLDALRTMGRHTEVVTDADAFLEEYTEDGPVRPVRILRYHSLVHLGSPRWPDEFEALASGATGRWELTLSTAEALLTSGREVPEDPTTALRMVRKLEDLAKHAREMREESSLAFLEGGEIVRRESVKEYWKRAQTLEAEALEKLGREDEARRIRNRLAD